MPAGTWSLRAPSWCPWIRSPFSNPISSSTSSAVAGLTVLSVASAGMTVYCIANPKACFGSCPTFYAQDEAGQPMMMAEGFSASVSPTLEDTDLDALFRATADRRRIHPDDDQRGPGNPRGPARRPAGGAPAPGGRILAAQDGTWWQATNC